MHVHRRLAHMHRIYVLDFDRLAFLLCMFSFFYKNVHAFDSFSFLLHVFSHMSKKLAHSRVLSLLLCLLALMCVLAPVLNRIAHFP